ncbi:hypothetical protein MPTK1_1g18270 [Marchantia polymorpha subsp. ruderalis]|uniref:Uncharacterized protein n=4 Tax=Marchantia polymorpha TaxID=3197 RepID=A0AAF6ARH7_MARPO|nr:hypothetical protein MARPO_0001s0165 [Marchantia polymorpha]BBM99047.1 hypothetical protein Mp_1g18270 [Marchantia polymorpha subsp. ruderalis]|eukprot:PTQ50123.1 hypothetical protein MARPO_0001s0165 [Marchantia polymorpha]
MGRSTATGSKGKRSSCRNEPSAVTASGSSAKSILAEARRLGQQASRKPEGVLRSPVLKSCVELFRRGITLPLSPPEYEEALFDLAEVLLQLCSSLQAGVGQITGCPLEGKTKKGQAVGLQCQNLAEAAEMCRESAEAFESVCTLKGQLEQEALVNSGVALSDWSELALELPESNGGGLTLAKDILLRAFERYSAALLSTPVDVELLVNYADCCVRRAELEVDHPSSDVQWNAIKELYELGLGAYASACANADARIGDDLAGLLHNWGSGLFSFAERSPDLEEALNFVKSGQEKFFTAIKFGSTDANIRNGLGECLTSFVDKLQGKGDFLQRGLDLLQAACNDGYGAVLKIDSSNIAALLGLGEAYLSAGKILIGQGLFPRARESLSESVRNFERAFELMKEDAEKSTKFKYEELCDSLYNFACAAALLEFESKAVEIVEHLLAIDAVCIEDVMKDFDLRNLHQYFLSKYAKKL